MPENDADYTKGLARNLAIGVVLAYAASTGLCFIGLGELDRSLAVAALPAVFAGPYVGILITLIGALRRDRVPDTEVSADGSSRPIEVAAGAVAGPGAAA